MLFSTFLYAAEAEIVRVGLFDHPPLVSLSPQTGGIFVEILEQLAAQENWELHYVPGSWQAGLDRLEAEEIDLLPSFTPSPTRQARFDFNHEPVVSTFAQIYSQQGLNIVSLADLEQRKVVGLRGDIHFQAFQEIINKLGIQPVLQEVDSDLAAFQQVANGEADALVTEYFASLIREKSFALQRTPLYFFPHSIAYGTKKGRKTHLLTALDNYLKKQQSDPASNYYKIIHHHLGQGYENSVQYSKNHIALTDKEQIWLNAHPVLRIAPNPDSPPLEFFDGQGHYQGLVADYMRIIAERLDVRLEVVRKENLSQAIAAVHSHEADIIGSSIPSEALLKQFIFSDLPFYDAKTVFISHGDIEKPVKIEDLAGNKLLVSADWSAEIKFIREKYPQIEIVEVSSALVGLLKLNFREYDYLLTSLPVAAYFSYQQDLSDLKVTGFFTDKPNQDTFIVRKDEPLLRNIMQKAMRSITPEERQRVEDKWLKGLAGMGNLQSLAIDLSHEERTWLKQNPQIKLTTYLDQAPLVIKNQDGSVSGIIPDLFLHFSQAIGQRIELELFESLSDAHQQHKDKALYGHGTLTKTPLYQRQYLLTDAYLNTPLYVFTHKDNLAFIRQDVDLRGRKISILSDFQAYISYLSKIDEVEIIFADSPLEQMRQLMTGEADAIMGHLAYPYLLNQYLMVDLAIAFVAEIDVGIHIGLNPEQTILQGILNKAIQHLSEARKANILAKWNQINATQVTPDLTEAEKTFLKSLPPLRVPLIEHQPPLTFLVEGQAQGYVNELLEQVSNSLDLEIQWIRGLSYSDSLQALKNAELDLLNNYSHTTDRDFVLASKSILTTSFVALGRINSPAIKTFQDIEGKRIVLVKDFKQTQVLQQHYPHLDMLLVNSVNEALRMLRSQEADYYIGNAVHAGYYLYQGMVNDLKIAGELPAESLGNLEFSFGISKQLPLLHSAIDKTLTALSDRQFQALKLKWLHTATDKPKLHLSPTEKAWIKNHPEIVFGTDASWQPYVIPNPDGSITGIEADILAQINQLSGLNIQIRLGSWVDMVEQARQRKIDGLLISTRHPERATDFLFSDSPYSVHKYIYTHKEMLNKTKGMQALTGKRVAFQQGSLVDEKLLKKYAAIPVPVTNNDEMIHLLLKGDVSAVIQGINFRLQLLEHMLFNIDVAFVIPDSKLPLLYSIRKDWPELQGIINKALAIIPHYQRLEILQKWTLQPQEKVNLQQLGLTIAEQHWLSQHPVISVAVDPDWAPLEFIDKQGRLQGISADYLQHLEKLLGVRFEPAQGLSWQEAVKAVKARQLDMFSSVRKTPERARYVNFTEPYLSVPIAFFTGSETHYIGHAEELSGKKVAVVSGYAIEEMLASDHPGIQLVAVKDIPEGLQRLAQGEVYAFADNILTTAYYVRELKLLQLKVAGKTTYANEQAMAARKDLPLLSSILHKALNTIPEAEHNRIYQRWIYLHDQPRFDYVLFWKILLAIALLFAIFIYWNWRLSAEVKHRKKAEQTARSAAEKLRVAELFARETIDALTAHLCVLDAKGMILTVNRAWCKFSEANPPVLPHYGIGTNYVRLCKAASTRNSKEAEIVAAGLQAVLQGKQKTFMLEYPCHSPTQQRWFVMMVSRFADDGPVRVVVAHENITSRKHADILNLQQPELMCSGIETTQPLEMLFAQNDVIAIGPGMGQFGWAQQCFDTLLQDRQNNQKPWVLDADALNLLAKKPMQPMQLGPVVLTPHPGEAARLLGCSIQE
ncbi:transporter substrate-binding domain-containing protein, partial [Candidatus Venteria ishoeyi]|uniref:transporter substrate-binding domain-containing protein n=1 Tax=Candidatus Venteria ishoeyi TaxID=1899563 RepID=UPI0015B225D6